MQSTCTIHLQDDLGNNYTVNNVPFSPDHGVDESIDVAMRVTRSATQPQRTFTLILLIMNQTVLTMSASDEVADALRAR